MPTPNPGVRREYRGAATPTTLNTAITHSDTALSLANTTGWPTGASGSFFIVVDPGKPNEEKILCSAQGSGIVSVAGGGRGMDGTTASAHLAGAAVYPVWTATEADQANEHLASTSGVHGVASNLVGVSDAQVLSNKTISGSNNTLSNIAQASITGLSAALTTLANDLATTTGTANSASTTANAADTAVTTHAAATAAHGATGAVVGTTNTQTLTNKTIDGGDNTLQNIPQTAVTGLAGTYSPVSHNHTGLYAPASHSHDYAASSHTHNYASTSHSHDSDYVLRTNGDTYGKNAARHAQWTNGTGRVHEENVSGSGTYYSVWVDGSGQFARNTSSRRFKENIRDHDIDPGAVLALRPRLFERKGGGTEYGMIAEEVDQHVPEIVIRDNAGRIDGIRYDLLAVALLNVVQDLQARLDALEQGGSV